MPPGLEAPREGVEQSGFVWRGFPSCGPAEESRAELGEPRDVVTPAHLLLEEAPEKETLCTRRFEHQAVVQHHRIEHVVVEDGGETGRGRHLRATVRGHLGVVRQDARVIKQLLEIDARLRDILKTEAAS